MSKSKFGTPRRALSGSPSWNAYQDNSKKADVASMAVCPCGLRYVARGKDHCKPCIAAKKGTAR